MGRAGLFSLVTMAVAMASSPPAEAGTKPRLDARPVTQVELLQRRAVAVRVRAQDANVKLRVAVIARGGRRMGLGRLNATVAGPLKTTFALRSGVVDAIRSCDARRLVVKAVVRRDGDRTKRRFSRRIEHQPPLCGRFFGAQAVWNEKLSGDAPLDPNSGPMMSAFFDEIVAGYQGGLEPNINTVEYSTPLYTVGTHSPTTRVVLDQPPGKDDLRAAFAQVPIPERAVPAAGTDGHMVVWQPSRDRLWEFWRARRAIDGWHAAYGGELLNVSAGPGHFAGERAGWGATASSLPLVGGLITIRELRRGVIRHALSMGIPHVRANVFSLPAQRTDGTTASNTALPEGARLRIDPDLDLSQVPMPPAVRTIARAAQRYGIYIRDGAGAVSFYAQDPTPTGTNPYPELFGGHLAREVLRAFPWRSLRVVKMDLRREKPPKPCGLLQCR